MTDGLGGSECRSFYPRRTHEKIRKIDDRESSPSLGEDWTVKTELHYPSIEVFSSRQVGGFADPKSLVILGCPAEERRKRRWATGMRSWTGAAGS